MFGKGKENIPENLTPEQIGVAFGNLAVMQQKQQESLDAMLKSVSDLTSAVSTMATQKPTGDVEKDPKNDQAPKPTQTSEEDFEAMTNGQLVAHVSSSILDGVKEMLEGQATKTDKSVQDLAAQQRTTAVASQLKELASTDGSRDLYDWQDEISKLHAQGKSTDPEMLYHEARRLNPERAVELDKKYEQNGQKADTDAGDEKPDNIQNLFGGMSPSSSGDVTDSKPEFETNVEAGNSAFDEAFKDLPEQSYTA